jgi:hypothetical protein
MHNTFDGMTFASLGYGCDIAPAIVSFGEGWHALEWFEERPFRWIGSQSRVLLASSGVRYALSIDIEPGPGVGSAPFRLDVAIDSVVRKSGWIQGRTYVAFTLPATVPGIRTLDLNVRGGGARVPGDPRILDARVHALVVFPIANNVVPTWNDAVTVRGWSHIDGAGSELCRTMGREAIIEQRSPRTSIELDLEPAPGLEEQALPLDVDVAGLVNYRYRIDRRTRIKFDLPSDATYPLRIALRCTRDTRPIFPDSRVLNFRFYEVHPPWAQSELLRTLAGLKTYTEPVLKENERERSEIGGAAGSGEVRSDASLL